MPAAERVKEKSAAPCVALGRDLNEEGVEVVHEREAKRRLTLEERVEGLEARESSLVELVDHLWAKVKELDRGKSNEPIKQSNDADIPDGTVLRGTTQGRTYYLQVRRGKFWVGNTEYESLSSAAAGVSGVRRSGWTFWKLADGRTAKDAFKG